MPELTGYIHLCDACGGKGTCKFEYETLEGTFPFTAYWKTKQMDACCPTCKGTGIWEAL